jgi:3-dehydrosphinganine reductase
MDSPAGHAMVVGGSSGIGLAIARALRARGHVVSSLARHAAPASSVDASYLCDVTSPGELPGAIDQATRALGPIRVLVYSAGAAAMGRTLDIPVDEARRCLETSFWGLDATVRAVVPGMIARRQGAILAISSIVALRAVPFEAYYAASKAAVTRYLGCLAHEMRPHGVHVHALHAGLIDTGFFERSGWWGMKPPSVKGSGVTPDDAARAAMALLDSGRESVVLGWRERIIALGDRIAPSLYDRVLRRRYRSDSSL